VFCCLHDEATLWELTCQITLDIMEMIMRTVKMEARWSPEGWWARGVGKSIYSQGDTLDELWANIREAVAVHFDDEPVTIQLVIQGHVPQATSASR